jgi:hypothetical protein
MKVGAHTNYKSWRLNWLAPLSTGVLIGHLSLRRACAWRRDSAVSGASWPATE